MSNGPDEIGNGPIVEHLAKIDVTLKLMSEALRVIHGLLEGMDTRLGNVEEGLSEVDRKIDGLDDLIKAYRADHEDLEQRVSP